MPKFDREQFGRRVAEARDTAGITQATLAEAAGVSNETVSRIERGAFEASLATAAALADVLGVSVDHLLGRADRTSAPRRGASFAQDEATEYRAKPLAKSSAPGPRGAAPARSSHLVAKLVEEASQLPIEAQRVLLQLARLLAGKRNRQRR